MVKKKFVKSLLNIILVALIIFPVNIYSEEIVSFDLTESKKILTELNYCSATLKQNEHEIISLAKSSESYAKSLLICQKASTIKTTQLNISTEELKVSKEKSKMFEDRYKVVQKDLNKFKKYTPWYKSWYFWSNFVFLGLAASN